MYSDLYQQYCRLRNTAIANYDGAKLPPHLIRQWMEYQYVRSDLRSFEAAATSGDKGNKKVRSCSKVI